MVNSQIRGMLLDVGGMFHTIESANGVKAIANREHWQSEEQAFADAAIAYVNNMRKVDRHLEALRKLTKEK